MKVIDEKMELTTDSKTKNIKYDCSNKTPRYQDMAGGENKTGQTIILMGGMLHKSKKKYFSIKINNINH